MASDKKKVKYNKIPADIMVIILYFFFYFFLLDPDPGGKVNADPDLHG